MIKKFNHVALAVEDLKKTIDFLEKTYGATVVWRNRIEDQKLESVLISLGGACFELLVGTEPESLVTKFIQNRGEGIHHVSFEVDQFDGMIKDLKTKGLRVMGEADTDDFKAAFIHPQGNLGVLTEIIEPKGKWGDVKEGSRNIIKKPQCDNDMATNKETMKVAPAFEDLKPMLRPSGIINGVMKVDTDKCTSCGLCILNCPFKCLEMDDNKHPRMKSSYICMSCSNCMVACPKDAVSMVQMFQIKDAFFDTQFPPMKMPLDAKDADGKPSEWTEVERTIMERRSVRHFKKDPIPEPLLRRVLEAGRFAPSGGNHQPWRFTVVTDPAFIAQLEEACQAVWARIYASLTDDTMVMNLVGTVPTSLFDPRTSYGTRCVAAKELPVFFNAPAVIFIGGNARMNSPELCAGICGQNMNLAAVSLGLGFCWSNFGKAVNFIPDMKSKLGFDDPWAVQCAAALGYPKFKQSGLVARHYRPVTWFRPGCDVGQIEE